MKRLYSIAFSIAVIAVGIGQSSFDYDVAGNRIKRFASQGSDHKPNNWRWKADAGGESGNTWLAPVNVLPVISTLDPTRLRMSMVMPIGSTTAQSVCLQYSTEPPTNISSTWTNVPVEDPATSASPFVIEANYSGSLANGVSTTAQLSTPNLSATGTMDELAASFQSGGKVVSSTTNCLNFTGATAGRYEFEYRITPTQNVVQGQVYYFRQQNAGKTANSYDYNGGFPAIAISPNYNGKNDPKLPDIGVSIVTGFGSYSTGIAREVRFQIRNLGKVPSKGVINISISEPILWNFSIGSLPAGWTYSNGRLANDGSVPILPGGVVDFRSSMVNNYLGFAASFLRISVDPALTIDSNGNNNTFFSLVFKQL